MLDPDPFVPHAIVVPERARPSPVFVVGLVGVDRFLRIDFSEPHRPLRFILEALAAVRGPLMASPFGRAVGFVINYRADYAVRFDLSANPLEIYDRPWRAGRAMAGLGGTDLAPLLGADA